jgi:hypothetical protein
VAGAPGYVLGDLASGAGRRFAIALAPASPGPPVVAHAGKLEAVGSGGGTVTGEAVALDPVTGQPTLVWTATRQSPTAEGRTRAFAASRR